ncbi:MAG TPA: hypothetical protein VJ739_02460 [Gemmataceae bacterium]|nr:hypothetical protein [Gemmataceae bacterium]
MPRRPAGPSYYPTRHAYFVQINRQQIRLAGPICEACGALAAKKKGPRCKGGRAEKEKAWNEYYARLLVLVTVGRARRS